MTTQTEDQIRTQTIKRLQNEFADPTDPKEPRLTVVTNCHFCGYQTRSRYGHHDVCYDEATGDERRFVYGADIRARESYFTNR